jgi:uncharacterized protein (TIGR00255 family)
MTGFGRAQGTAGPWSVDIAIRSVNHRFLDLGLRLREDHAELEPVLRRVVSSEIHRGKVEVAVRLRRTVEPEHEIKINEALLETLLSRFSALAEKFSIGGKLEVRDVLTVPQVVRVETSGENLTSQECEDVASTASRAVGELVQMREAEGALLAADLLERLEFMERHLGRISSVRGDVVARLHSQLKERLALLLADVPLDSGRLEQEAVILADRSDIAEELTRLSSHLKQFKDLLARSGEPVGKKMDFLTQEIQREINTIGSKSRDLSITREVVDMKTETEKIREQVQNLE